MIARIALLIALCSTAVLGQHFFAVLHDSVTHEGSVVKYDLEGNVTGEPTLQWPFSMPLVEMTSNWLTKEVFIISFPNNEATLFVINSSLGSTSFPSSTLQYFDLQFSPWQNTYYGIAVTSAYGRELTQFTLPPHQGAEPVHTPIIALPYMWFVNASTFDDDTDTYYGLLNNFPGKPNSTTAQKLAVGYFGTSNKTVQFVDLQSDPLSYPVVIVFVAWVEGQLVGLGNCNQGICFVHIDPLSGVYRATSYEAGLVAGPIFPHRGWMEVLSLSYDAVAQQRVLVKYDARSMLTTVVTRYESDSRICAAVTHADW